MTTKNVVILAEHFFDWVHFIEKCKSFDRYPCINFTKYEGGSGIKEASLYLISLSITKKKYIIIWSIYYNIIQISERL